MRLVNADGRLRLVTVKTAIDLIDTEGLQARHPFLPLEEEGRLSDPRVRDNFVERVSPIGGCAICSGRDGRRRAGPVSHRAQAGAHGPLREGLSGTGQAGRARGRPSAYFKTSSVTTSVSKFPTYVAALLWGGLLLRDRRLRAFLPVGRTQ
jgi:hypothetical protein